MAMALPVPAGFGYPPPVERSGWQSRATAPPRSDSPPNGGYAGLTGIVRRLVLAGRPCHDMSACEAPYRPASSTQLRCYEPRGAMFCGSPMPWGGRTAGPPEGGPPGRRFVFRRLGGATKIRGDMERPRGGQRT